MPTAAEMPDLEILLSEDAPSPLNPLGVKGAGRAAPTPAARSSRPRPRSPTPSAAPGAVTSLPLTPERLHTLCRRHAG